LKKELDRFSISGNVWHGTQEPWHNWDVLSGRFVSEFGMLVTFSTVVLDDQLLK
jgi:hypothetical protein